MSEESSDTGFPAAFVDHHEAATVVAVPVVPAALVMPEPIVQAAAPVLPAPVAKPAKVTLDDFCRGLSKRDNRVELIAMFHHTEIAAGLLNDTPENFQQRYVAVATRPTK